MIHKSYFLEEMKKLGYQPNENHMALFELFYDELIKWNSHTNLTRITEEKEFIDKHLLDSLSCIKAFDSNFSQQQIKAIDIGTGAGFPLLPLWFFFPHWKISLLDSVKKKLDFISHFAKIATEKYEFLKLENIEVIHSRAEDLARDKKYREKYDAIFSRAVSRLASLVELSMPFIKEEGVFIGMKSYDIDDEIKEADKIINMSGSQLANVIRFELLETGLSRSLVVINKVKKTPTNFPRKAGLAQKQPIV